MARIVSISTEEVPRCAKCGRYDVLISRHHMGNDGLLRIYSAKIAEDYSKFLDCCPLCDECHMTIHWIYDHYCSRLLLRLAPVRAIKRYRTKFIRICQRWLKGKLQPATPVSSEFQVRWRQSMSSASSNLKLR